MGLNVASTAIEWLLESYECLRVTRSLYYLYLYSLYLCGHDTKFVKKLNIFAKKLLLVLFTLTELY